MQHTEVYDPRRRRDKVYEADPDGCLVALLCILEVLANPGCGIGRKDKLLRNFSLFLHPKVVPFCSQWGAIRGGRRRKRPERLAG